jgi:hypothetical protein
MSNSYRLVLCFLLVLPASVACRRSAPTTDSSKSPLAVTGSAVHTSPLSSPTVRPVSSLPTPSSKQVGTLFGALTKTAPRQPAQGAILCLGQVIVSEDGTPLMGGLDRATDPCTQTDQDGRFVFTDVPEGRYALFLDLFTNAVMLRQPSQGGDLLINVQGGSIADLGTLAYDELPGSP